MNETQNLVTKIVVEDGLVQKCQLCGKETGMVIRRSGHARQFRPLRYCELHTKLFVADQIKKGVAVETPAIPFLATPHGKN